MVRKETEEEKVKRYIREFHTFWLSNGEPHPSSNEYLSMNRQFFYLKGYLDGVEQALEIEQTMTDTEAVNGNAWKV